VRAGRGEGRAPYWLASLILSDRIILLPPLERTRKRKRLRTVSSRGYDLRIAEYDEPAARGGEGETRVHARENFKGTAVPLTTSENSAARAKTTLVSRPPCYANSGSPMKLRVISIAPRLVTLNDR